jgi:predicted secreted protein
MDKKLLGKDFVLLMERSGKMIPVCCGRELTMSITSELIEATKAPSSDWRSYLYGIKGYTVSFSGIVIVADSFDINDFYDAIANKKTLAFVAQSDSDHDMFFAGNVLINNIDTTGAYNDIQTYSITATGDGPLTNSNPYAINILTDNEGNALEDGNGNILVEYESGDLLKIDYTQTC